ncbi:MAG: 50S ribosomal protein L1 [Planctomycetes bacterium]|nr:50S ribosomal protein L1 [Planctomycetota bacterium]
MAHASKRHRKNLERVDATKLHTIDEAITTLQNLSPTKFDETVEIVLNLSVDPKKTDQLIRGSVSLPRGLGREKKVIVFAEGNQADAARKAGAIEVGGEDLAKKITDGWLDFDVAVATPGTMKFVGKLGKVLGPQGKMPSPKAGTVTDDVAKAVQEFRAGKIEYRTDAGASVHAPVGKRSFAKEALRENITAFLDHIKAARPPSAKGEFIEKIVLSTTMSPGVMIAVE